MRLITRKQHLDFQVAQNAQLQAGKRIRAPSDLHSLLALATFSPAHGAFVDSLDVLLRSAFLTAALRRTLTLLPNITDFTLVAPCLRSSAALHGIHLPQLQFFRTDLPHGFLVGFLEHHPTITELILIGGGAHDTLHSCPLQAVDFSGLTDLHGPASCVCLLAPQGLFRLTMELDGAASAASNSLSKITSPLLALHTLILDIYDGDCDVLNAVAAACPGVRKLKLTERALFKNRQSRARRAYNDPNRWFKTLKKLPELEEILLRTSTSLVRKPASWKEERALVHSWTNGIPRFGSRAHIKPHPMLYHVGLWYSCGSSGGGCVAHWSKPSGTWERTISIVNPSADQQFI